MSVEATAEALAPETAAPIVQEPSINDEMDAIWDKHNSEKEPNDAPEQPEAEAEAADEPSEEPAEKVEIPSEIPRQLRAYWDTLSEEARTGLQDFARETNRKMSEQGRLMHGISPIRDSLVEATQKFPHLSDMSPQDVAQEVFKLAEISAQFESKPVETLLGLAQKHGMVDQLKQALTGQPVETNNQLREIIQANEQLRRKVAQLEDPNYIRSQVTAVTSEERTMSEVESFAKTAEHWDKVENTIPELIPAVRARMGEDASAKDVLQAAYDLAVGWVMPKEGKAPEEAAEVSAAQVTDPEKAKAVLKAKSVNVSSQPSKPRQMSQRETDEAIWAKYNK